MNNNLAVLSSFCLYILYVLLPLIPAVLIFRLFPETKVTVSGPLQNLTLNATGAFAAYVVTVALGAFLVTYVEKQIEWSKNYVVEGVIENVGEYDGFNSSRLFSRYNAAGDASGKFQIRDYSFVLILNHPVLQPETVWVNYWGNAASGVGALPAPKPVPIRLLATPDQQRFRIETQNGQTVIVPETDGIPSLVTAH